MCDCQQQQCNACLRPTGHALPDNQMRGMHAIFPLPLKPPRLQMHPCAECSLSLANRLGLCSSRAKLLPDAWRAALQASKAVLAGLAAADAARAETFAAKNDLEAYILATGDRVSDDEAVRLVSTEEQRGKLRAELAAAEDWLYMEGADEPAAVFRCTPGRRRREIRGLAGSHCAPDMSGLKHYSSSLGPGLTAWSNWRLLLVDSARVHAWLQCGAWRAGSARLPAGTPWSHPLDTLIASMTGSSGTIPEGGGQRCCLSGSEQVNDSLMHHCAGKSWQS